MAALGDTARARGMTQLAWETSIARDGLYRALSPTRNPSFATPALGKGAPQSGDASLPTC